MRKLMVMGVAPLIFMLLGSAQAHRNGCHRWHSCPSDTGSYTMGSPVVSSGIRAPVAVPSPRPLMGSVRTTTTNVNLRRTASAGAPILLVIPRGRELMVACQGGWCRTTYQGRGGYVSQSLLTTSRPAMASQTAARQNVYYANCSEARAAGAAPVMMGEPGYRSALDRDNDGVGCE